MAIAIEDAVAGIDSDSSYESGFASLGERELQAKGWNDPRNAPIGYWRIPDDRMPRGRITMLQYGQNALERIEREAGVQLRNYGTYKSDGGIGAWKPWTDPFLGIVQRNGLAEFDAQQIVDLGWHRPPTRQSKDSHRAAWKPVQALIDDGMSQDDAVKTVMPQLRGRTLKDYICEFCPSRRFNTLANLKSHESLMHKDHVLSRGIQEAIVNSQKENGGGQEKIVEAILTLVQQLAGNKVAESEYEGAAEMLVESDTLAPARVVRKPRNARKPRKS
jgi:hypothetical protein